MDGEEVEQIFNTVEKLVISHRAFSTLFARVEATEKAIQDLRSRSTCLGGGHAAHVGHGHKEPALNGRGNNNRGNGFTGSVRDNNVKDVLKSVTSKRLNEIGRGISAKKSTWTDLRKQYSPKGSMFSPKRLATGKKATNGSTQASDMDSKLAVDEVYSQVAAMAAYGVELLRIALSNPQVDRMLTKQASDIFATLCATLTHTRDQHRDEIYSLAAKRIDFRRHTNGQAQVWEPDSEDDEPSRQSRAPQIPNGRNGKEPVQNERSHPYRRDLGHSKTSKQPRWHSGGRELTQKGKGKALHGGPAAGTRLSARIPSDTDNRRYCIGESESPAATSLAAESDTDSMTDESESDTADTPVAETTGDLVHLDPSLGRRSVIHAALLLQGNSESDITAYFNQVNRQTNAEYDRSWKHWATWCVEHGIDPCIRSDEDLEAWLSEGTRSQDATIRRRSKVKSVWSMVEGNPPPARYGRKGLSPE
ncbi:hypothetical protein GGH13_000939 [Coemansia sp. S155-1]|nr:hypothetical protein GGH13_000939 [Coemansia sp. S155-1]